MVKVDDETLLTPPTFPRECPIVEVPETLEALSIGEVREAQAGDTWFQDLVIGMDCGSASSRFSELLWDRNRILNCKSSVDVDLPPRWAALAALREHILTLGH
jgi:hypothetical protein